MTGRDRVVLDTSALYALLSSADEFHEKARATYTDLLASDKELLVPSYVLVEFGALVHRRLGFDALNTFVTAVEGVHTTLWINQREHEEAWMAFKGVGGRGLSLVDWITLLAAKAAGASIFAFDTGYAREGADVLP